MAVSEHAQNQRSGSSSPKCNAAIIKVKKSTVKRVSS